MPAAGDQPPYTDDIQEAAQWLQAGCVIAYPTATVYGIGCLPDDVKALNKVLQAKAREAHKGLILIGANQTQLEPYTGSLTTSQWQRIAQEHKRPVTWVVPAAAALSELISGGRDTVAIRITHWPVTRKLCLAADQALVSTSANLSGEHPVTDYHDLALQLVQNLDGVLTGDCAKTGKPSTIRDLLSGAVLRP
ncbi:MAG: L-threonylcarbamoyladenylate synthase [Thiotrichales bacterium]